MCEFIRGSVLSPLLFTAPMDEATEEARREALWELVCANDLVGNAETEEEQEMFNGWKEGMEEKGQIS